MEVVARDMGVKKSYRVYFTVLFLSFGAIIALLTSVVNYNLEAKNVNEDLDQAAQEEFLVKRTELKEYTQSLEDYVASLRNSRLLHDYIRQPSDTRYADVASLFFSVTRTNPMFMQVRFLDETGKEQVRVDWHSGEQAPVIVDKEKMQDKSHRYYFIESSQVPPNSFWYSKLDLNVENKKIEVPYKPVLRVASPVYVDQKFAGVVIVNAHAKEFLNRFRQSSLFSISLFDQEGHFIVHHDDEYSWSRYLQTGYDLEQDQPELADEIMLHSDSKELKIVGNVYVATVGDILTQDKGAIFFHAEQQALNALRTKQRNATVYIIVMIFALSIPVALLLSTIPARLNRKVATQNQLLKDYVELIDENIITSKSDNNGNIIEVSSAYAKNCGYDKGELVGRPFSMLRDEDVPLEEYERVWDIIKTGQKWKGELRHVNKAGEPYWTSLTITPYKDDNGVITSHTAIHQNITDRKALEELSITDELTGLNNRRYFNHIITKELKRAQRAGKVLTFVMMDVDHFKQYNDHYGHQKGDVVLSSIGDALKHSLNRGSDYSFRLGGEEFGAIFTDLSMVEGMVFAEKIRRTIENLNIEHQWSKVASVITVSMGVLSVTPGPGVTVDEIYKKADEALYTAKNEGRNRIFSCSLGDEV